MTEDCVKKNSIFFYSTTLETLKFYHLTLKNSFGPQLGGAGIKCCNIPFIGGSLEACQSLTIWLLETKCLLSLQVRGGQF